MITRKPTTATVLIGLIVTLALLTAACGSATVSPEATSDAAPDAAPDAADDAMGFLSGETIHTISVAFDQDEYEAAVAAYTSDGSKEWITATVTIDGSEYSNAGIRLKGNSSLFGLDGNNARPGPGGDANASNPETLPWLIRLDRDTEGQNHNGIYDIVVASNNSTTALNEAVALDLLEAAGLASQDSAYAEFSVNGSYGVLRLVMEHPDDIWMTSSFSGDGILYKAEATGDYRYRGDEPDSYDEVFDVEAGEEDLDPLIEFLDFINNADDEAFHDELADWLDTGSFATYLAAQDLIANTDDIDERGNNSYLYVDLDTGQFTVVPWDHNLAFGGLGGGGGDQPGRPPAGPSPVVDPTETFSENASSTTRTTRISTNPRSTA